MSESSIYWCFPTYPWFYTWYLVLSAPFEKFVRVVFLVPLTGIQYSEKVIERIGVQEYTTKVQEEHKQKFLETFKEENFPPRSSVLLSFSKEGLKVKNNRNKNNTLIDVFGFCFLF